MRRAWLLFALAVAGGRGCRAAMQRASAFEGKHNRTHKPRPLAAIAMADEEEEAVWRTLVRTRDARGLFVPLGNSVKIKVSLNTRGEGREGGGGVLLKSGFSPAVHVPRCLHSLRGSGRQHGRCVLFFCEELQVSQTAHKQGGGDG